MTGAEPGSLSPAEVAARLTVVRARIAAVGVDPATVEVLAVTKGHPLEVVALARAAGLFDLGENYAQELVAKATATATAATAAHAPSVPGEAVGSLRWHFIGRLQTNKVGQLAPFVTLWQTVDRAEVVAQLVRRAPGARVLIQVNATGEAHKAGCQPSDTAKLVDQARAGGLIVEGLMTLGPTDSQRNPETGFALVRGLVDALGLARCSMGMSDDLEAALRAGSTMVRIGTALFGPRRVGSGGEG